jgi:uncharacterized OB-fold protein
MSVYLCPSEQEANNIAESNDCPTCFSQIRAASILTQQRMVVHAYVVDYAERPHVSHGREPGSTRHVIGLEVA